MGIQPVEEWYRKQAGPYARQTRRAATSLAEQVARLTIPEPNTGCWLWLGGVGPLGYGTFGMRKRMFLAHRVSYELHRGFIPEGMVLDHLCKQRSCVNPDHLRVVTRGVNSTENSTSICAQLKAREVCHNCGSEFRYRKTARGVHRHCYVCMLRRNRIYDRKRGWRRGKDAGR